MPSEVTAAVASHLLYSRRSDVNILRTLLQTLNEHISQMSIPLKQRSDNLSVGHMSVKQGAGFPCFI